jgi:hypothetical protein
VEKTKKRLKKNDQDRDRLGQGKKTLEERKKKPPKQNEFFAAKKKEETLFPFLYLVAKQ